MMNPIWLFLLCGGILAALVTGRGTMVFPSVLSGAADAVDLIIGLAAFLSIWSGMMRLADRSGLLERFSVLVYPLLRPLFRDLPREHKAWAPMVMNVTANFLGLGNAATPFGIQAMKELHETAEQKGTATKEMITFMALNTSAVSIVPGMILGIRADAGSANAAEVIVPSILASLAGLIAALSASFLFAKLGARR
ncbi:MAG: hypothetical protein IIY02_03815 [Firmicutes bacterium]|nr:hypothetical protein [Bacillota bacterium]